MVIVRRSALGGPAREPALPGPAPMGPPGSTPPGPACSGLHTRASPRSASQRPATGPASGGPPPPPGPASGGPDRYGYSGPNIWDNGYFFIKGNELDLKMFIHREFTAEAALGPGFRSKTLTPRTIGETRESPTKSMLCLKAWMLWRAHSVAGWVDRVPARQRLFAETEQELYLAVQRLQPQADGLLGNELASRMLVGWAPGVVTRLRG